MRRSLLTTVAALVLANAIVMAEDIVPDGTVEFTKEVKNFQLTDVVSGKARSLKELQGQVVVLGWYSPQCGACPEYNKRIKRFHDEFATLRTKAGKPKVSFFMVCSNSMDRVEDLKDVAANQEFKFPILRDADGTLATYFDVMHNCTFAVIDQTGKLRFRGGFDDALDPESVTTQHVKNTTSALLAKQKIATNEALSFG